MLPHLLSMTATPIPRTLALTVYGDLDITVLEGMPHGRKPIITKVVLPNDRENTYEEIRRELNTGRQLYVICPRIDEPDPTKEMAVIAKSVNLEAERLNKDIFPEYMTDTLHSKMLPKEKENALDFLKNDLKNQLNKILTSLTEKNMVKREGPVFQAAN